MGTSMSVVEAFTVPSVASHSDKSSNTRILFVLSLLHSHCTCSPSSSMPWLPAMARYSSCDCSTRRVAATPRPLDENTVILDVEVSQDFLGAATEKNIDQILEVRVIQMTMLQVQACYKQVGSQRKPSLSKVAFSP